MALLGIEARLLQRGGEPHHGVHRRADLVAHHGEKRGLGAGRFLGHHQGGLRLRDLQAQIALYLLVRGSRFAQRALRQQQRAEEDRAAERDP
jgi:hypothetical protein